MRGEINPLFLREEELRRGLELFLFAQRDYWAALAPLLHQYRIGTAHFRCLSLIHDHPHLSIGEIQLILRASKQNLHRVLADLKRRNLVIEVRQPQDRRVKSLSLSQEGLKLSQQLWVKQKALIAQAYSRAGAEAVQGFVLVLQGLIDQGSAAS